MLQYDGNVIRTDTGGLLWMRLWTYLHFMNTTTTITPLTWLRLLQRIFYWVT